jgi:hypothetical protein
MDGERDRPTNARATRAPTSDADAASDDVVVVASS